jgi:hypothetical protein
VTFTSSSKTHHNSRCHRQPVPSLEGEGAPKLASFCVQTEVQARPTDRLELLSWGCPKIAPSSTYASSVHSRVRSVRRKRLSSLTLRPGLPSPGSFRPCRSTRLRRFPPLERRRLVASCSQPWGSLRFYPCAASSSWPRLGLLRRLPGTFTSAVAFPQCAVRDPHLRPPSEGFPSAEAVPGSLRQSEECCKQPFLELVPARSPLLALGCLAGTALSLLEA